MQNNTRTCLRCGKAKEALFYAQTKSKLFPGGRSTICTPCLETMCAPTDLQSVDAVMRWLDLPFDINKWTQMYEYQVRQKLESKTLSAYISLMEKQSMQYESLDWKKLNDKWIQSMRDDTLEKEVEVLDKQWLRDMRKKWPGDGLTKEDYEYLESNLTALYETQGITDSIQRQNATMLIRLALNIEKAIQNGDDAKDMIASYNSLIKSSNFTPGGTSIGGEFQTIGEIIDYYNRNGWHPTYATADHDIVDFTSTEIKTYLNRLYNNEPGIADMVEAKLEKARNRELLEEDLAEGRSTMELTDVPVVYEDEFYLDQELLIDDGSY